MNKKIEWTKKIAKFAVGWSVAYVVKSVIANNISPEKPHQQAEAWVGGIVIGSMASDVAEAYTDKKIDDLLVNLQKLDNKLKGH